MEKTMSPRAYSGSTTFVQADATTFKELVQRLTGPHDESPPCPKAPGIKRPTFKLHERRNGSRPKLTVVKPNPSSSSSSSPHSHPFGPSISPTDISKLRLSDDPSSDLDSDSDSDSDSKKAIKEGRFYLYSSPRGSRLRNVDLLHLFPES